MPVFEACLNMFKWWVHEHCRRPICMNCIVHHGPNNTFRPIRLSASAISAATNNITSTTSILSCHVSAVLYSNDRTDNKKLIRRWDSEHELSLRRHCTRTKNTIDSCINSATDRFLQRRFTKFSEITQCNGHHAVQGHSRSPILVPIERSYTTSY